MIFVEKFLQNQIQNQTTMKSTNCAYNDCGINEKAKSSILYEKKLLP